MKEVRDFLEYWQPIWEFILSLTVAGVLSWGQYRNQMLSRKLQEAQARKEGIDPERAEGRK